MESHRFAGLEHSVPHGDFRSNGMAQKITGTEFGAETALVAGSFGRFHGSALGRVPVVCDGARMIRRENDQTTRCFGDDGIRIILDGSHHQSP
jgi:hypothetical protein